MLVVYGGLLVLTYWTFQRAPTGFIPQQDQGRLICDVQLPDSASLQRTQEAMARSRRSPAKTPGVAHTVAIAGMSFLLQANSSNFGSMFIVLDPFDERQGPRPARRRHHRPAAARSSPGGSRMRWSRVRNSSPIPGLGVAGGFKIIVEDRGGRGLAALQSPDRRS